MEENNLALLSAEILLEKSMKSARKKVIQKLQQARDKKKITLTTFRSTGQLMTTETYLALYRDHDMSVLSTGLIILPNAEEVLRYAGGFVIQLLAENHYALHYNKDLEVSLDLKSLEKTIFERLAQDLLLSF
tara:strand:+ start:1027 stop:1422 length:396 start_codon:yes stop_codon:yes gene_type:complete